MKVKKNNLLLIACFVWAAAGFNILRIGILAYPPFIAVLNFILSAAVFCVFFKFIFWKLVVKHTTRILGYTEERQFFLKFFDIKAFIIMAAMMTLGITLRVSHIVPDRFIAVFYTGLGIALMLAGILFGYQYIKVMVSAQRKSDEIIN